MQEDDFSYGSINAGLLRLHIMAEDDKLDFLKKVKDFAQKNNDSLLLELVGNIANPKEVLRRGENLKIIGIDKDTLTPVIVDKSDISTISGYTVDEKDSIAGLPVLKKK